MDRYTYQFSRSGADERLRRGKILVDRCVIKEAKEIEMNEPTELAWVELSDGEMHYPDKTTDKSIWLMQWHAYADNSPPVVEFRSGSAATHYIPWSAVKMLAIKPKETL